MVPVLLLVPKDITVMMPVVLVNHVTLPVEPVQDLPMTLVILVPFQII
jgi:hypothetical protein